MNGRAVWVARHTETGGAVEMADASAMSPDGERLYVVADGQDGSTLLAYDVATGELAWERYLPDEPGWRLSFHAMATGPEGAFVYAVGRDYGRDRNGALVAAAFETSTGSMVWSDRITPETLGGRLGLTEAAGGYALAVAPDGARIYAAGLRDGALEDPDALVVAYDALTGAQAWAETYTGFGIGTDGVFSLAITPDGARLVAAGRGVEGPLDDGWAYLTVALDTDTGEEAWKRFHGGPSRYRTFALDVAVDPAGDRAFVTGYQPGTGYAYSVQPVTVAYDLATGDELWVSRAAPTTDRYASAYGSTVAVSPDGAQVFVAGGWGWEGDDAGTFVVAFDAATGEEAWLTRTAATSNVFSSRREIAVGPEGARIFVAGGFGVRLDPDAWDSSRQGIETLAVDTGTGGIAWRNLEGPSPDEMWARVAGIHVTPDGARVLLTGGLDLGSHGMDTMTFAYDTSAGNTTWVAAWNEPDLPSPSGEWPVAVQAAPDGARVFTAYRADVRALGPTADLGILAHDAATGDALWSLRYDAGGKDLTTALAVSPDGKRVYLGGHAGGPHGVHFITLAVDASTGAVLWDARYDGPGDGSEGVWGVRVSPDGSRVYVAGTSREAGGQGDAVVLAYDAATGNQTWVARHDTGLGDGVTGLLMAPDGSRVYATGATRLGPSGGAYGVQAYDAATGDRAWAAEVPFSKGADARTSALSPDGSRIYVAGPAGLVALDAADGTPAWTTSGAPYEDVAVSVDGSLVYVTGDRTVAYDASTGLPAWALTEPVSPPATWTGQRFGLSPEGVALEPTPDGRSLVVVGPSYRLSGRLWMWVDVRTVVLDAQTGAWEWSARHAGTGGGWNSAADVAVSPDASRVFTGLTGWGGAGREDVLVAAYDVPAPGGSS